MRFHMLAVLGLALALPGAASAQEHKRACCAKDGHADHATAAPPQAGTETVPGGGLAAPAYDTAYEGLVGGVIYSVMRHPGMDVQLAIGVGEKSFDVLVAPMDWLDGKQVVFRPGERIEIVGARQDRGSGEAIVAREIYTADQTIVLRDIQGRALWK
jgi:hypothetical protein